MLAMLWLELASLVFNGCGFDPFGLKAQSSQSKISGQPLFSRKTDNSLLIVEKENTGKSKHGKECGEWASLKYGLHTVVTRNSDRCSKQLPINTFILKIHCGQEWESFVSF